jgi:hypothetical protein
MNSHKLPPKRPITALPDPLRGLVEANQQTIAVAWPRVDGQHVFHSGYERAVGLRRDDPVLAAMGLKSVFLSARPIVLSLARSTMPSSTTLFSNNRKVQRARPLGGLEQAKAINRLSNSIGLASNSSQPRLCARALLRL